MTKEMQIYRVTLRVIALFTMQRSDKMEINI